MTAELALNAAPGCDAGPEAGLDAGRGVGTGPGAGTVGPGDPRPGHHGELRLTLAPRSGRTVATAQYHAGALQTLRPLYLDDSGQVCYMIVNPGGAYLRGDRYRIDLDLHRDARLLLTTQSATKVYRTPDAHAEQRMTVRLGAGSALEYVADQLILYRGADYRQFTVVEMDAAATLIMSEIVTPGWSPDGGLFSYDRLRMRTEVRFGGRLLAIDNLLVEPAGPIPPGPAGPTRPAAVGTGPADDGGPGGIGFLEGRTHLGSLIVVDARVTEELVDEVYALTEEHSDTVHTGLSVLGGPGFVVRCLGDDTAEVQAMLHAVTALVRARWFGQQPLNLRKY